VFDRLDLAVRATPERYAHVLTTIFLFPVRKCGAHRKRHRPVWARTGHPAQQGFHHAYKRNENRDGIPWQADKSRAVPLFGASDHTHSDRPSGLYCDTPERKAADPLDGIAHIVSFTRGNAA
jgi:hypothetical protein